MSLDTVVEDIRDEARARAKDIRETAEERADEIVAEAESDAERIEAERAEEVEREIEQEREQTLSGAQLKAKNKRLEARRDTLEAVRETAETRLSELSGERRKELTYELLAAAAEEFEDASSVDVYARADDEALLDELLDDDEFEGFSYAGEYDCLGGVVVESDESRIRVNNTFDSVLDEVWEDNLQKISSSLFEDK